MKTIKIKVIITLAVLLTTIPQGLTISVSAFDLPPTVGCDNEYPMPFAVDPLISDMGSNDFFKNEKELYDYFDMSLCSIAYDTREYIQGITPEMQENFDKYSDVEYLINYQDSNGQYISEGNFNNPSMGLSDKFDFTNPIEPQHISITFYYTYEGQYTSGLYIPVNINLTNDLDVSSKSEETVNIDEAPKTISQLNELLKLSVIENNKEIDQDLVSFSIKEINSGDLYDYNNPKEGSYKVEYTYTSNFEDGDVTKTSSSMLYVVNLPTSITLNPTEINIHLSDVPENFMDLIDLVDTIKANYVDGTYETDLNMFNFSVEDNNFFTNPQIGSTKFNVEFNNMIAPVKNSIILNFIEDEVSISADKEYYTQVATAPQSLEELCEMFNLEIMLNDNEVTDTITNFKVVNNDSGEEYNFDNPQIGEYAVTFMYSTEFGTEKEATSSLVVQQESQNIDENDKADNSASPDESDTNINNEASGSIQNTGITYNTIGIICLLSLMMFFLVLKRNISNK